MGLRTTQRRVGFLLTLFSCIVAASHALQRFADGAFIFSPPEEVFYWIFVGCFVQTLIKESNFNKLLQVAALVGAGVFTLHFGAQDFIGVAILSTAVALSYVYGFFDTDAKLKVVFFEFAYLFILIASLTTGPEFTGVVPAFIRIGMVLAFINTFCVLYFFILTDLINKIRRAEELEKIELIKASLLLVQDRKKRDGRYGPFKSDSE